MRPIRWKFLIVALFTVLAGTFGLSSGHFENPDAHLRLAQAFSLADGGGFQLKSDIGNPRHGNVAVNDQGERYSVYGPGQIILFTPLAILAQKLARPGGLHPHYIAELMNSFLGVAIHFLTGIAVFMASMAIGRSRGESIVVGLLF